MAPRRCRCIDIYIHIYGSGCRDIYLIYKYTRTHPLRLPRQHHAAPVLHALVERRLCGRVRAMLFFSFFKCAWTKRLVVVCGAVGSGMEPPGHPTTATDRPNQQKSALASRIFGSSTSRRSTTFCRLRRTLRVAPLYSSSKVSSTCHCCFVVGVLVRVAMCALVSVATLGCVPIVGPL